MSKKAVAVISILITIAVISTLCFAHQNRGKEYQQAQETVARVFPDTKARFSGIIDRNDEAYGDLYAGDYVFEDSCYRYFVSIDQTYIEVIFQRAVSDKSYDASKAVSFRSENQLEELARSNYGSILKGDVEIRCYDPDEGSSLTYEVIETVNGIETGTKCSFFIDDMNLTAAVFLKGDYEAAANKNKQDLLSAEEAFQIAKAAVLEEYYADSDAEMSDDKYSSELKTFKGRTYWLIQFFVYSSKDVDEYGTYFEVQVEVNTGEILMIAKSF